jgi:hypothetical protein
LHDDIRSYLQPLQIHHVAEEEVGQMTYLIVVQAQLLHRDQVLERAPFDGVNLIVGQQSANEEAILV